MSSGPDTPTFPPHPTPFGFGFTNEDEKMELSKSSNVESIEDEIEDEIEDFTPREVRRPPCTEIQENKGVEDFRDVLSEEGGALAKGLFRGVTGILKKPLEGAKSFGVEGFVQGVGKGIIGAAAQPVSGVFDLLSKTTEGANAMRMKIAATITSDEQLLRRRLPGAISGDNLLQPYDNYKAQGQVILQLAESGSFFGQVDLFKVRSKFALSDSYEDHFLLRKGKIIMLTHRRVILLQQPSGVITQRKFSPAKDSCSILWDIMWDDLATMELTYGLMQGPPFSGWSADNCEGKPPTIQSFDGTRSDLHPTVPPE